ncbi:hypothetical protein [Ktedonobacter sp. SOSP1-85]|uniref:hypothetical protein n=1 Tax=Ktedonobacter sp. SOSP1-85 TaxID=2778367 RepID=UPI0019165F36|nr:hypothetical protein [Ktedonobacter sp. SOSP1-85]
MSKTDQQNAGLQGDYRLLTQSLRATVAEHTLSQSTGIPTTYVLCREGETPLTLTVLTQVRAFQREVKAFMLSDPDKSIGIIGIWHHGVEEVLFVQRLQGQLLCRSLRHQNDNTIKQGLRWLQTNLGDLHDYCLCPKML